MEFRDQKKPRMWVTYGRGTVVEETEQLEAAGVWEHIVDVQCVLT